MIVFDVDGTLIGGDEEDWASFNAAFHHAAGFALDAEFYRSLEEVTAQAIVHEALIGYSMDEKRRIERVVCQEHLRRLTEAHERHPGALRPTDGALALLKYLKDRSVPVAIASGGWVETTTFRLRAAGIPFEGLPMVTSSEFYSRSEIIAAAVTRAGGTLEEATYVGDGIWDFRATQKLGISFIGVGRERGRLRDAGASYISETLHPYEFCRVKRSIGRPNHPTEPLSPSLGGSA
jgi:phosphoglycolate phosphatase-like HAD superfamily hydrolase